MILTREQVLELHEANLLIGLSTEGADDVIRTALSLWKRIADLEAELSEIAAAHRTVMSESCPTDESHCACVPVLRRENDLLKSQLKATKKESDRHRIKFQMSQKFLDKHRSMCALLRRSFKNRGRVMVGLAKKLARPKVVAIASRKVVDDLLAMPPEEFMAELEKYATQPVSADECMTCQKYPSEAEYDNAMDENERLITENARLREALGKIALGVHSVGTTKMRDDDMREIAEAALKEAP